MPEDFMFQLTWDEATALKLHPRSYEVNPEPALRSQIVILAKGKHIKHLPYAFTEQGVAMLSGILGSDQAIQVNIEIMRAFIRIRKILASHTDLAEKLAAIEKKYAAQFKVVFDACAN
jgi:hypothetical protein